MKVAVDKIRIDNELIDHATGILILMNKPAGYVCSHDYSEGLRVYDLLPEQWMLRDPIPSTIGRLDKDTTGCLLITNNTKLNHMLSSPKRSIDKVYQATVDKPLSEDLIAQFAAGTLLLEDDDKPCLPAKLVITDPTHAEITLHEGKYHQVKRMFGAFGYTVTALHRSRFGQYTVESVPEGTYVDLEMGS